MASRILGHLDQIAYSCEGIDSLQYATRFTKAMTLRTDFSSFPAPKIFTNALLANHDITSLIRDTEAHERALFSVPPPPPAASAPKPSAIRNATKNERKEDEDAGRPKKRRQTVFNVSSGEVTTGPPTTRGGAANLRKHTAVAAVLGGEMHDQIQRGERDRKSDADVDVLLRGAEKLCGVYELPGARDRIATLRAKHRNGVNTMAYYETKLAEQATQLEGMNKNSIEDEPDEEDEEEEDGEARWTEEDLKREEAESREMEAKKRELQARLRAMEKDLGGLMNM